MTKTVGEIKQVFRSTSAETVVAYKTLIHMFEWLPDQAGRLLLVKDLNGAELFRAKSKGDGSAGDPEFVIWKAINAVCNGVVIHTIGGGTLNTTVG